MDPGCYWIFSCTLTLFVLPFLRSIWNITKDIGLVRFAEKSWLKILFADLLWEKNTVRSLK